MRIGFLGQCLFVVICTLTASYASAQTTIFNETFNEANGATSGTDLFGTGWNVSCPTCEGYFEVRSNRLEQNNSGRITGANVLPTYITSSMDISSCNTLTLSMNYVGDAYGTQFESELECNMGSSCAGDPSMPDAGGCLNCWDFFLVELVYNDGFRERARFIGANGDLPTAANINYSSGCIGDRSSVAIEIRTQTWAVDEFITADNIMLVCQDPPSDISISQSPGGTFCVGENVELSVNAPGESIAWFDPNGSPLGSTNPLDFNASASFGLGLPAQTYSVITTDGSGCKSSATRNIIVNSSPVADLPLDVTVCEGDPYLLRETGGDATMWDWDGPYNPMPGSTFSAWNLTNLQASNSGTYSVTVTDGSGCEGSDNILITVEPGGSISLPSFSGFCENASPEMLSTMISGVTGDWSGPGISGNVLDPTMASGTFDITFTPSSGGCVSPQTAEISIIPAPASFSPASPFQVCGSGSVTFDLTTFSDEVNGSSGDDVVWYEDITLTTPIMDPDAFISGNTTVFAVVENATCVSASQALDLVVSPGPEIMMAGQLLGCADVMINNIIILGQSGNQAYYDMPGGMGNLIPVGTVFTQDTVIYAFDSDQGCSDEQRIEIIVGQATDAGPDLTVDTCFSGSLDLQTLLPSNVDRGNFYDMNGVPIPGDTLETGLFGAFQTILTYQTEASAPCPGDEATYTINVLPANNAGRDSSVVICTSETVEIESLTFDNGAEGVFQFSDGTPNPQTSLTMQSGDQPFMLDFFYIVNSSGACEPDTAFLRVEGLEEKTENFDMEVCPDFSIDVFGITYDQTNPLGTERGASVTGCDSVVNVNLQFRSENRILIDPVLCVGNSIMVNSVVYDESNPIGTEIIQAGDQFACDSIVDVNLSFDTEVRTSLEIRSCETRDTVVNGITYNLSNLTGSSEFTSSTGCDSIVDVIAIFDLATDTLITGIYCPGDTLVIEDQIFDLMRPTGGFTSAVLNSEGCDSSIVVDLQFDLSFTQEISGNLCSDMVRTINGNLYGASNPSGIEIMPNNVGCDSVVIVDFNILSADSVFVNERFCNDTIITINNVDYNRFRPEGEELIVAGSSSGCNQYVFIDLEFIETMVGEINESICRDDSIVVNGNTYNALNPQGSEVFLSSEGCDSTVNIDLDIIGVEASFEVLNPDCMTGGEGALLVDIQSDLQTIEDIILDGISIRADFINGDPIENLAVGSHELVIFSSDGCSIIETFLIEDSVNEDLDIKSNLIDEEYYQLRFTFTGVASSILWTPSEGLSCTDCESPEARPSLTSIYILEVQDENSCTFRDSIELRFLVNSVLYKPNIFSPNEDGVNDVFFINSEVGLNFTNFAIFDRWGNRVHHELSGFTGDPNSGWNGDGELEGVYIYYLEVEFAEGPQTIVGEVSLIR